MKFIFLTIILLLAELVYCQQGPILSLRYNEDYSRLKNDSTKTWYKKIKYIPLKNESSSYLTIGGEFRYQLQYFKNEDWGDGPKPEYTAVYNRFMVHGDLHMTKYFRIFGQLVSTTASGRVTPNRAIDENRLDVQQVFADINVFVHPAGKFVIRAGRQELLYGSQRLIAVRENPNTRMSFDAVKAFYIKNNFQVDIFYSQPVRNKTGVFDDPINHNEKLWSIYTVINQIPVIHNADFYYIGYQNLNKFYNNVQVTENRHSIGTRIWKQKGSFQYDLEALYQFGKIATNVIAAYTISSNINYQFSNLHLKPVIGFKSEVVSGDKSASDNKVNTFNPLFPRGAYFGLAALIGPSNLIDIHPNLALLLIKDLTFSIDYDLFWRYSEADGLYGANAVLLYPATEGKHIGNQLGVNFEYIPDPHVTIRPEFTFFNAGDYLKQVSAGKDILFAAITLQLKF